jgi:integrase
MITKPKNDEHTNHDSRIADPPGDTSPVEMPDAGTESEDGITVGAQQYAQSTSNLIDNLNFSAERYGQVDAADEADIRELVDFCGKFASAKTLLTKRHQQDFKFRMEKLPREELFCWYKIANKRTAYVIKACLRAMMISRVQASIHVLEQLQNAAGTTRAKYLSDLRTYASAIQLAKAHGVFDETDRSCKGRWLQYHEENRGCKSVRRKRKPGATKRNTVNHLPDGWQEVLAKAMQYDPALDLLIATGLRTAEINSARLTLNEDGLLMVTVKTAKTPKGKPDRFRHITLNHEVPAVSRLLKKRLTIDFSGVHTERFRTRLGLISTKLFRVRVSPKVFRHALAGLIKVLDGADGTRGSVVMGHISTRTTCVYGNVPGKSSDTIKGKLDPIIEAQSTEPVRETRSKTYRHQKRPADKVSQEPKEEGERQMKLKPET